jgi:hypothetical protein
MDLRRKAAMTLTVGLTAATSLIGIDGSAIAVEKRDGLDLALTLPRAASSSDTKRLPVTELELGRTAATQQATTGHQDRAVAGSDCHVYADNTGDLCLFSRSRFTASRIGIRFSASDLCAYDYPAGPDQGQSVCDHVESIYNFDDYYEARVFSGEAYTGYYGVLPPRTGVDLSSTYKNKIRSFYWR